MYRTQMKMQLQKQQAEMLARKEEEEERKRRENQHIPQQSRSVDVPISKSHSNSELPNDVLKVCVRVCVCVCVCVCACAVCPCVCLHVRACMRVYAYAVPLYPRHYQNMYYVNIPFMCSAALLCLMCSIYFVHICMNECSHNSVTEFVNLSHTGTHHITTPYPVSCGCSASKKRRPIS